MKLEPVALSDHLTDAQIYAALFECDALERIGHNEEMLQAVRKLIDSAIPPGYKLVPVEPTEAMLNAARDWSYEKYGKPIGNDAAIGCWKAMIAAIEGEQ